MATVVTLGATAASETETVAGGTDVCEIFAEALRGLPTNESLEEIRTLCPSLSPEYVAVHVLDYAP